jgi:hypothetical protein
LENEKLDFDLFLNYLKDGKPTMDDFGEILERYIILDFKIKNLKNQNITQWMLEKYFLRDDFEK